MTKGNGSSASGVEWLRGEGESADVVMSSRVRLARNLAGFPFVTRASSDDRRQISDLLNGVVRKADLAEQMLWVDLSETPRFERELLVERHLISKQHSKGDEPRAVAVSSPDERLSIMVNEEDHLRIQAMRSGLALTDAYRQANEVDDRIEATVDYAYSDRFGFLTACPTNVGTGIRVSVMLHLPALKLSGDIDKVRRAAKGMNLAVRGFYGEGSEAVGDLFQISNQTTLGKTEEQILGDFESEILPKVIEYERRARRLLLERRRLTLEDRVHRAIGVLTHARLLNADEALHMLSQIRLGALLGVIENIDLHAVSELILLTQPAHLQRTMDIKLDQAGRRSARADLTRQRITAALK